MTYCPPPPPPPIQGTPLEPGAAYRAALIHMLRAQREQINAALALLEQDEPQTPAEGESPRRRERPVFGSQRTGG